MAIPDRFQGADDHTTSLRTPFLVEVWHNLHQDMDSMSKRLSVVGVNKHPVVKGNKHQAQGAYHNIRFIVPKSGDLPRRNDLLLIS
jgi:hypothetical protein